MVGFLEPRYVNFVYALIVGSCSCGKWGNLRSKDIWDCREGVEYFAGLVWDSLPRKRPANTGGRYRDLRRNGADQYGYLSVPFPSAD